MAVQYSDIDKVIFKDLGPQISYTTVFFAEYFGPLLLHSLFYLFPKLIYRQAGPISTAQTLGYMLVMLHFIKRELETIHVHRFSNATMPLFNLPKNCFHYWVLGGLFVAYPLYTPGSSSGVHDKIWQLALVLIWITMQMCNLTTHVMLRDLRPPGSKLRQVRNSNADPPRLYV